MNSRSGRQYQLLGSLFVILALCLLAAPVPRAGTLTVFGPKTLTRTTGSPNVFNFTFVTGAATAPFLLHIDNHGVTSAVVTLNGVEILGPNDCKATRNDDWKKRRDWDDDDWERDDDSRRDRSGDSRSDRDDHSRKDRDDEWRGDHDWKAVIERAVTLRSSGNNTLRVELRSKPGTHLSIVISGTGGATDTTPPTITATAAPVANAAGWNRADVQVTFACSDAGSGVSSCPPSRLVNTEGRGQVIAGTATDKAGNNATASVTLNIDKTAPTILGSVTPAPNEFGWVNQNATVSFACADALSGVGTCSAPIAVSTEGGSQAVPGTATDIAGNAATSSVAVSLDKAAPIITAAVSPAPNARGWNRGDVTVTFTCTDGNSGIASCPAPVTVSTEGAGQQVSGTARDRAGNTASASAVVNIDKTGPVVSVSRQPAANANGWNNSDVTVSFTCGDGGAGVVSCPDSVTVTTEGAQQVISREVTDNAGNTATAATVINIDKTAPTLTAAALPPPNANGWNDTNVTVTFTCADPLSGIATCQPPVTAPEGAQQSVSGSAVDKAGNTASASITLNVDKTPVSIRADVQPPPNAAGWNNTNAVVNFVCQDTGSGVGTCPPPASVTLEGAGQVFSGTGNDLAGNQSTASATVNVDRTPPQIAASVTPAPNADGWINHNASVAFVCSDPGGSGIASCPAPTAVGEGAAQHIGGTAVDVAGNSATADVAVSVDTTPPAILASISPAPSADGWITQDATVTFTCTDSGSGVATCPAARIITAEGANQVVTGTAVDRAGNSATATVTLNIVKTSLTITAAIDPRPNAAGWNRSTVIVSFTCAGNGTNPCPAPVTVSTEGAGQVVTRQVTSTSGSVAEASVTLNIDKSAPVMTAAAAPAANAAGWNRGDVVVSFTCTDGLSGIAVCPAPIAASAEGAGQHIGGTATDRAGNTATAAVTLSIDKTAPTVTIASPAAGSTLTSSPAAVSGNALDALSGLSAATCNGTPVTPGAGGALSCAPTLVVGENTLVLTATDAAGNIGTVQIPVTFGSNRSPVANAGSGYSGAVGSPLSFSGAASTDPDQDPLTYAWTFGDGGTGSGVAPTHTFSSVGTYNVTLTVTDPKGLSQSATTSASIVQPNRAPTAIANGPYSGTTGSPVTFSGSGTDPDSDPLTYIWNFGDGATASGATASHVYTAAGTLTATLTANDGQLSGAATASVQVSPANRAPTVTAGGPYAGVNGTAVAFAATGSDADGDALTYTWDFGDGGGAAGRTASHAYTLPGAFTATVTVNDGRGGAGTATAAATIAQANRAPKAIAGGPYSGQVRSRVLFSAESSSDPDGDALVYTWTFGDGTSGTGVAPNHGYTKDGTYTASVTVDDGRGGRDVASATVTVAALPPPENQPPTARPGGPYVAEAGVVVALNGGASSDPDGDALTYAWSFGDGSSGNGPSPTHVYASAGTFTVTLTVSDGHAHTNAVETSASVSPATDRAPPSVSLSVPARVLPGTDVVVTAVAADNVGVESVTFDVDGASPSTVTARPYQRTIGIPPVVAPGATIRVRASAVDAAGNVTTAQATITIDAAPDTENPFVTLTAPAEATPGSQIRLIAVATDNVGVASVDFSAAGGPIATVPAAPYESTYSVPSTAAAGSTLTFTARGTDFTGNHADATASVVIAPTTDTTPPVVTLTAPSAVAPGALLHLSAEAADSGGVASVEFYVEGVRIATVAQAPYAASFAVPSTAAAGSILHVEARASDFASLEGRDSAQTIVAAAGNAFVIGEVFDDTTGLPLADATVALTGADASGAAYSETAVTDGRGRFLIRAAAGRAVVATSRDGMTRVDRPVDLQSGAVVEVLDGRLTPLAQPLTVSGVLGGVAAADAATLTVPGGVASGSIALTLTAVSQQGIEGPLPHGWSPVQAVDIGPHGTAFPGSTLVLPNSWHLAAATPLVLARWDEPSAAWHAIGDAAVSGDERTIQSPVDVAGAYALLLADTQPLAPAHPIASDVLAGVAAAAIPADALSLVNPNPRIIFYSPGVKSDVAAGMSAAAPLTSGTVVWSRMTESYRFLSGGETHPEPYTADIVFYQRAMDPSRQSATFVVSPSLVFEPLTLADGVIRVELFARPDAAVPIAAIGPEGGVLTAATGESIQVPPGAGSGATPVQIAGIAPADLGVPMPDGLELLGAMRLTFTGTLAQPASVSVPLPASLGDATGILLVRLQELQQRTRLVLVGAGHLVGDRIVSSVVLDGTSVQFEGVRVAGRYAFVHTTALTAFAAGHVTGIDNTPFAGALVSTPTLAIVALSRGADGYIAPVAVGGATVTATDLFRSDSASGSVTLAGQNDVGTLDLHLLAQPPRVTSILPANDSTNVAPTTAIVVTFSEAIDQGSVSGANSGNIALARADGTVVPSALVLSSSNAVATLRPTVALDANTAYTAVVSSRIKDLSGYEMGAAATATFTTLDTVPPLPPPAGSVTAGIPVNGSSTVRATQGTAGVHDRVSIVNLRTGQISPVLLDANGGFTTTVAASAADKLRLRIVDAAGNETTVDLARFSQSNADGSTSSSVGPEGGHIAGPAGTAVDVSPGTFPDGAIVTIKPVAEAEFPVTLTDLQKTVLTYAGGVQIDFGGAIPAKYVNVSIPAAPGDKPDDQWVVSAAVEVNGRMVMNVVDTAKLIAGRIQTSSPPCPGVTGAAVYGIHKSKRAIGYNYGRMYANGYGGIQTFVEYAWVGFVELPFLSYTPSTPTPMCLPTLSGNVSIGVNHQRVTIPAAALAPADRELVITSEDGYGQPTDSHLPKSSVYYTFEVPGKDTDSISVAVTDATTAAGGNPTPVPNVRVTRATSTSILVAFSPDVLTNPGVTEVIVHNVNTGAESRFPQAQVNYVVSVPGPAGSVSMVRVIAADGAVRDIPGYTVSSPSGPQRLIAKAVAGTIDPTWDQIDALPLAERPPDARGVVDVIITIAPPGAGPVQQVHVPASERTDGGFSVGINALLSDVFSIEQIYANHDGSNRISDSIAIPTFHVTVSNPVTGAVLRTYVVRAPGAGEGFNLGTISDDVQAPYLVAGPSNPQSFDPGSPLTFTFSESMDAASLQLNMTVQKVGGAAVAGHWQMSDSDRVATFVPDAPLLIGESYTVTFNGPPPGSPSAATSAPGWITDRAGNPISRYALTIKTFLPRLITTFRLDNDDFTYASAPVKPDMPFRDIAIRRKPLPGGSLSTSLVAVTGSAHGSKLLMIDASDPTAMSVTGRAAAGNFKSSVTLVTGLGQGGTPALLLRQPTHCGNGIDSTTFTGDLAVTTSFNSFYSYISFFDVTRPDDPCLLSDKLLSATPDYVSDFSVKGTVKAAGYARGLGIIPTTTGLEAYVAVGEVGAMAVDAGKNIPEVLPADRKLEGLYAGDYRDLVVFNDRLVAVDQGGKRLDLLDASLTLLSSLDLVGGPRRVSVVPAFGADENDDGNITQDEIHDLAVVGEDDPNLLTSHVEVADVTEGQSPTSLGSVGIDGVVRDIEVDADRHRAYVATFTNAGGKLYVLDLRHLATPAILWSIALTSPAYNLTLDRERGLLYVATDNGIDVWSVNDNCCDLAVDLEPKPSPDPTGDKNTLVTREKAALQQAIAAGLVAAAASCPGGIAGVTMLEQGSGACLWDARGPAAGCGANPNYQPGLSDHDFEVFLPGPVDRCITDKLTDQFVDETGARKLIQLPDGSRMKFDDISFFPVSQAAFASGVLDLDLPPAGGDDAYGDHGLGRQQLLLKWLLEGEWVSIVPYALEGPDLNEILKNVRVPALEGYEWSMLQEYAFVKSTALVRIKGAADPATSLHKLFVKQLHGAGKAGIRAALARMVADDAARARILAGLDRQGYRKDGCIAVDPLNPNPASWSTVACTSFEQWVASSAARTVTGTSLPLFSVADVQKISRFYRVKADREYIVDEVVADGFVSGVWDFIKDAQLKTKPAFTAGTTGPHPDSRAAARLANVALASGHTATARGATKLQLVPHVSNRGFITAQDVEVTMWTGVTGAGSGVRGGSVRNTLMGGDDHWLDFVRSATGAIVPNAAGKPQPSFELAVNTFVTTGPVGVAFTIDLEERKVKEAVRQNNFSGFYYYLLPGSPPPNIAPPAPVPADKLDPNPECDEAPLVQISQAIMVNGVPLKDLVTVGFGAHLQIRITVRNLSAKMQTGITVCSSFVKDCTPFPDLAPGAELYKDLPYVVPAGQSVVLDGAPTVRSDSLGVVTGQETRVVSVPSLYAIVPVDASIHPTCLPADPTCSNPSQVMQGGRALRYFRVIDTTTLNKVPGAVVETKFEGPGLASPRIDTFTAGADGVIGNGAEPGMPMAYTAAMEGNYTVTPVSVNGSPMTAPDLKPLYIITSAPLEYTEGLKAGVSMKIGGKILGGKGTLGAGGGLSLGLTLAKKPVPLFKKLTIGRSVSAKASLSFEPDIAKFDVSAGFSFKAEGPSASASIGVGVQIGDKYQFPTFPLPDEDRMRLAGLAIETATRAASIDLPGGPVFAHVLGALTNKVTDFQERKTSDSTTLSLTGAVGLTGFKLNGGFGSSTNSYTQEYRANFGLEAAGSVTGSIGAERLVKANQLVASAGISGEISATAGLTLGRTREANTATSTGNFGELEFVRKEVEGMLNFSAGISGGLDYSVTLDPAHSYNPVKLEIAFSGKKNFGWNYSGPGAFGTNLANGDQFTRTYTVTDPDTILPMLSTTANIAMLLPQGFSGVVLDPTGSFGMSPTNMFDQLVDLITLLGRNSAYSDSIEKGNGIALPLGFDVSLLAEGAKAGVEVNADHSLSFTLESGVLKNHTHYKLEDYPSGLLSLSSASNVLSLYADALSSTSNTSDTFRGVVKTPPGTGTSGSIKSTGSAEIRPATESDYAAVTGLLSFDFNPVPGPVRTRPYRPADVFGPADKPHYGMGGFHQFVPFDQELGAPAPLILDFHDEELIAGVDKSTITLYQWNKDRSDWDPVPATADPATNTVRTTISRLGLFTLGPAMPAGDIAWSVESATDVDANAPTARRHVVFVSNTMTMNNGSSVPSGTLYHVISTSPASSMENYAIVGDVTTPDLRPDLDGAQIAVGADGRLRIEIDYPAGIGSIELLTFSDVGTAFGSPVLQVVQQ